MSIRPLKSRTWWYLGLILAATVSAVAAASSPQLVPKWGVFETSFQSRAFAADPFHDIQVKVIFTSSEGESRAVDAFWDGGKTWRVRFSPDQPGRWIYSTVCNNDRDTGLHHLEGAFLCTAASGRNLFEKHGPVQVSRDGHYLQHEDGTPFFWLADTAWNGPLLSSTAEWETYCRQRQEQKFNAVQWVATQWRGSPSGDRVHELAFTDENKIKLNPRFFTRLDRKAEAANAAGLLNAPVLLWAIAGQENPGFALPEEEAILLARYMVARWGAYKTLWVLAGDGDYRGAKAERWRKIGNEVFTEEPHAPVVMHPGGTHWVWSEFSKEPWVGMIGYQSGHGQSEKALRWLTEGPVVNAWKLEPAHPLVNLEPPYENALAYESKRPIGADAVRRSAYWSVLLAVPAGVSYGADGLWAWGDGTKAPPGHPNVGPGLPWQAALQLQGGGQMGYLAEFFRTFEFWRLRPAPELLSSQPGQEDPRKFIAAAQSVRGDLTVAYIPEARLVSLDATRLPARFKVTWFNPRSGERTDGKAAGRTKFIHFETPGPGDWVLLLEAAP